MNQRPDTGDLDGVRVPPFIWDAINEQDPVSRYLAYNTAMACMMRIAEEAFAAEFQAHGVPLDESAQQRWLALEYRRHAELLEEWAPRVAARQWEDRFQDLIANFRVLPDET